MRNGGRTLFLSGITTTPPTIVNIPLLARTQNCASLCSLANRVVSIKAHYGQSMSNKDLILGAILAFILAVMFTALFAIPFAFGEQATYPVLEFNEKVYEN